MTDQTFNSVGDSAGATVGRIETAKAIGLDEAIGRIGMGPFQLKLFAIFGLVWAADAMQVLAVGFTAPSIAATFGMSVPAALQTGTLFFLGMMLGAAAFGRIADRYGRRTVLVAAVLLDAAAGLASAFAPSFELLLVARFITGLAVGGVLPVDYAMMAEFLPSQKRGRWLVLLEGWWAVGTLALTLVFWWASSVGMVDAWRAIFLATAFPALIGIFLRLWVPESPYYLLNTGRDAAARDVLGRVAEANGTAVPDLPLAKPGNARRSVTELFTGVLAKRTVLILALWLLVSSAYYGVFVWLPNELAKSAGTSFVKTPLFLVCIALAQLPGYALAAWGVEKLGRRPTLIAFLLLSALGCFLYAMSADAMLVAGATLLMSFALLGTWGALYAWTPELYPTALRGTGMGLAGAMARLGGLLAPSAFAVVIAQGFNLALTLFAALLALAAVLAWLLRVETRAAALD